eukprot:5495895-Prymnesium_polylepis.2
MIVPTSAYRCIQMPGEAGIPSRTTTGATLGTKGDGGGAGASSSSSTSSITVSTSTSSPLAE